MISRCRKLAQTRLGAIGIIILRSLLLLQHTICRAFKIDTPTDVIRVLASPEYDKYATPTQKEDGVPTMVSIGFYVEGMSSIRAATMDFHMDIYFEQRWQDKRLQHNRTTRVLVKDTSILQKMWHPDLYFANAKSAATFHVMSPNFLLWIFPNGTIFYDSRVSLTLHCNMDLFKYPLDHQMCDMRILSYAYTVDQLNITWRKITPILINPQLTLPDMYLINQRAEYCDGTYHLGTWACLRAVFGMRREIMYHVLQSYVPTMLIVVISWFSFWLDVDAVPGRVSLCITTLLTLATQASSAKLSLPQVSYAKAIDVWMELCQGMVFGVLIEFTIVNYLARQGKQYGANKLKKARRRLITAAADSDNLTEVHLTELWNNSSSLLNNQLDFAKDNARDYRKLALNVDKTSRVAFPIMFLLFNIIYWNYYLFAS